MDCSCWNDQLDKPGFTLAADLKGETYAQLTAQVANQAINENRIIVLVGALLDEGSLMTSTAWCCAYMPGTLALVPDIGLLEAQLQGHAYPDNPFIERPDGRRAYLHNFGAATGP